MAATGPASALVQGTDNWPGIPGPRGEHDVMGHTTRRAAAASAAVALLLAACGNGGEDTTDPEATDGDGPHLIYITPTPIGGNPFLELGEIGTEEAAGENGLAETYESSDVSSRRANVEAAVDEAPDIIVLNTFDLEDLAQEFAQDNPDQDFILIDSCPEEPAENLYCGVFREQETSYLLGIAAGSLTETGNVGTVLALDIPFLHRYSNSFALGAQSVDDSITDSQVVIGGDSPFTDPARAKEQALALTAQDVDHIFAAGAGSNGGVFEAVEEEGVFAYGVDVNECGEAPGHVVDNSEKRVENVVIQLVDLVLTGEASNFESFGLAEDGMSPTSLTEDAEDSGCVIMDHPDIIDAMREARDEIIDGELEVPDPLASS